jgi:cyclophilin family peptidyl-prolyl cis-trans isomerase
VLAQLQQAYPDQVLVAYRHFPLTSHPLALIAAYASEAAGLQGKFWEMHDILFESQQEYASCTEDQFREWVAGKAADLELDLDQFNADLDSPAVTEKVQQAQQRGAEIGIPGTPLVLINGQPYQGPRDFENFEAILNLFQLADRQFTECPPMVIDPAKQYIATLKTEKGDIVIQLFADKAPLAVNSFVFLAREGWFNGVTFHRVLPGFVAQAGDPSATGMGGPGYFFRNETNDLLYDKPGMVGMANSGADSNGSQFFITFAEVPDLNGGYTIFGEVIEGMDVAEQLSARDPANQMNLPPGDAIVSVEIDER